MLLNIKVKDKDKAQNDKSVLAVVKNIEDRLGNGGRILVRPSGTEPLIRVMVEAESEKICQSLAQEVVEVLRTKGHAL